MIQFIWNEFVLQGIPCKHDHHLNLTLALDIHLRVGYHKNWSLLKLDLDNGALCAFYLKQSQKGKKIFTSLVLWPSVELYPSSPQIVMISACYIESHHLLGRTELDAVQFSLQWKNIHIVLYWYKYIGMWKIKHKRIAFLCCFQHLHKRPNPEICLNWTCL